MHALPGLHVVRLPVGGEQVLAHQLDGLLGRRVGEVVGGGGHQGLHRVGEDVDAGVGGDGGGHAGGEHGVQDGHVGQEAVLHQGVLDLLLRVGDDGEAAHLGAGAAGGGHGDELAVPHVAGLGGEEHDGLGRVDGRAAAEGDDGVGLELQDGVHAPGDGGDVRVGLYLVEDPVLRPHLVQDLSDIAHLAAGGHEAVGDDENFVQLGGNGLQAAAHHDLGPHAEGVHRSARSFPLVRHPAG